MHVVAIVLLLSQRVYRRIRGTQTNNRVSRLPREERKGDMANPADLSDDELKKVIATGIEPDETPPTPAPEETPPTPPEQPTDPVTPPETPPVTPPANEETPPANNEEEPRQPSRREQLRVEKLLNKYGNPFERRSEAPLQPAQPPQPQPPTEQPQATHQQMIDYAKELNADPELIKKLEADRDLAIREARQTGVNEGRQQGESSAIDVANYLNWHTNLRIDSAAVHGKYGILDPDNKEEFHPAIAHAMNQRYLQFCRFNPETKTVGIPDISYKDFVEAEMELNEEIATFKNIKTVKNVAQQAATTGLRPDGSQAKKLDLTKVPQNMSLEELYASIGQTPPTK